MDHSTSAVYFHLYDGNGNTGQLINGSDGSIVAHYEYDPFGKIISLDGGYADDNAFRFSTKYHDTETNLIYYGYRYYSTVLGRWISRDPLSENNLFSEFIKDKKKKRILSLQQEISKQLYAFIKNNPVDYIDNLGLLTVHIWSFRGKNEAWGHASLTLDNGTHISWWPCGQDRDSIPFVPNVYEASALDPQPFEKDVEYEGQRPDIQIKIDGLDEQAIQSWWLSFKKTHKWKTLTQNCSTTVADALKNGGAKVQWDNIWTRWNIIWTPASVEDFAKAIQEYMESQKPKWWNQDDYLDMG